MATSVNQVPAAAEVRDPEILMDEDELADMEAAMGQGIGGVEPAVGTSPAATPLAGDAETAPLTAVSPTGSSRPPQSVGLLSRWTAAAHTHDPTRRRGSDEEKLRLRAATNRIIAARRLGDVTEDPEVRERNKMLHLFNSMDTDGSGFLSQSEIKDLVRSMGDRMSTAQIATAMSKMDPEMKGEVSFERFAKWWKHKKQEYRRDLAKHVNDVFALVDSDGSGELSLSEIKKLHAKVLKKLPGTIEFNPPFNLLEDFRMMQAAETRSVQRKQEVIDHTDAENKGESARLHPLLLQPLPPPPPPPPPPLLLLLYRLTTCECPCCRCCPWWCC